MSGIGRLTGADVGGNLPAAPTIKSVAELQAWLPGTTWKQVDANWRFVFEEDFVRRPRSKNKMPWKAIRVDAVEVTASKGKRLHTYRFHESHRWFTNDHKGQVFQLEKQEDEYPTETQNGDRTDNGTAAEPTVQATNQVAAAAPSEVPTKPVTPAGTALSESADGADALSFPLKIAAGLFALPLAVGLLALIGELIGGSSNANPNSLQSDQAPTGNTLEDHSSNTGRLIGGILLYAADITGLAAMIFHRPHSYMENMAYPFLSLLLVLGLNLMFLRFHLILSRNPKGLLKWWGVLSVPCEVRSIRADQLQRIEITRETHSSGSDTGRRRISYSFPVRLKHELGTADLVTGSDFETACKHGERIAMFMGLDLHASKDGKSKSRKSGAPHQSLRERIQAGTEKVETPTRPGDCRIKRNLDEADVVFELPTVAGKPQEKIYVSAKALRIAHGDETFVADSDQIAGLEVKDSHDTIEMRAKEADVDASSKSFVGNFAIKFANKQYAKSRL